MRTLGVHTTQQFIFIAEAATNSVFAVTDARRLAFSIETSNDRTSLVHALRALIEDKRKAGAERVAILGCNVGRFASALEAIKSEVLLQFVCDEVGLSTTLVSHASLRSLFGCQKKEKWQDKARAELNSGGHIAYWSQGMNGAVSAAYRALK